MAGMTESEKLRAKATGTELVWEGKRTQAERIPLPFQVILRLLTSPGLPGSRRRYLQA